MGVVGQRAFLPEALPVNKICSPCPDEVSRAPRKLLGTCLKT